MSKRRNKKLDMGSSSDESSESSDGDSKKTKPVRFVPRRDRDESEDERPAFGGLGSGSAPQVQAPKPYVKPTAPSKEFGQFERYTKGIGLKLLKKHGYIPGQGLGVDGTGISAPIDVKLRPKGMGIGHNGFDERTDAVRAEQGELVAVSEPLVKKRDGWKRSKEVKKNRKVFMTAQELVESVGVVTSAKVGGKIRDMTGKEERVIEEGDGTLRIGKLVELLHNVNILADLSHRDLLQSARQCKIHEFNLEKEIESREALSAYIKTENVKLDRMKRVTGLCNECRAITVDDHSWDTIDELYGEQLDELLKDYYPEFCEMKLDALVVSLIQPTFKHLAATWQPLTDSNFAVGVLGDYRKLLMTSIKAEVMTPFETMIYTNWLPKVRHAVMYFQYNFRNEWDAANPEGLIRLLEAWYPHDQKKRLLPIWMWQNITTQLLLPKLNSALEAWTSKDLPLHAWLFPWVPYLQNSFTPLYEPIRRKIDNNFKRIQLDQEALKVVIPWVGVLPDIQLQKLITNSILPKLVILTREIKINPKNQQIDILEGVLHWRNIVGSHMISHLLAKEFFNKWHEILWRWITSKNANFDEITQYFEVKNLLIDDIKIAFQTGLDMMHQGTAPSQAPIFAPVTVQNQEKMTFMDLLEQICSESNVVFIPINKRHSNGREIYSMGKKQVYVNDGVVFMNMGGRWEAVSVDDAISRA